VVLARIKRWLSGGGPPAPAAPRPLIGGAVAIGGREWKVREERRAGPWPQLLVLTAADDDGSQMHVRIAEAEQIADLAEVEPRAASPACRWFADEAGARWEARLVLADTPGRQLVKLIHWPDRVHEGEYPFEDGLGLRTDAELRELLARMRS